MSRATWIASQLREAGLRTVEHPGWQTRGSSSFDPRGVVCHHTASRSRTNAPSLDIIVNGRSDLPGPLAQVVLARDGTCIVVASGRANHAGRGGFRGLSGNSSVLGIEAENDGVGEPWTAEQLDAYPRLAAALLAGIHRDAEALCGHREWAPGRKIDPHGIDMDWMRRSVDTLLSGGDIPRPQRALGRGDSGADVREWQEALAAVGLDVAVDGDFGPATEAATRRFQDSVAITVDGLVGPATRAAMAARLGDTQVAGEGLTEPSGVDETPATVRVLGRGDEGPDVRAWQEALVAAGESIAVDGDFGPETDAATRRFQARASLTVDGLVGPLTRAAMRSLSGVS